MTIPPHLLESLLKISFIHFSPMPTITTNNIYLLKLLIDLSKDLFTQAILRNTYP